MLSLNLLGGSVASNYFAGETKRVRKGKTDCDETELPSLMDSSKYKGMDNLPSFRSYDPFTPQKTIERRKRSQGGDNDRLWAISQLESALRKAMHIDEDTFLESSRKSAKPPRLRVPGSEGYGSSQPQSSSSSSCTSPSSVDWEPNRRLANEFPVHLSTPRDHLVLNLLKVTIDALHVQNMSIPRTSCAIFHAPAIK